MALPLAYAVAANVQGQLYVASGTTSATGAITFAIPAGTFSTVYVVNAQCVRDTVTPGTACFAVVRSFTTTSVVVQVFESKMTNVVLGGSVEGLELSTLATTVHLTVFGM